MWQVEFPRGWYDIDETVQDTIQFAYESGRPTVEFAVLESARKNLWRRYEIDFNRMEQSNLDAGRVRKVRLLRGDAHATLALEDGKDGKRKRSSEEKGNKMPKTGSNGCAAGSH